MPIAAITKNGTIRSSCMLRNDFAGCSTGNSPNSYYETKGAALRAFESVLDDHGLCYDPDDFLSMPNDDGRIEIAIFTYDAECDETIACVGRAILVWHRMENSGRYEFIGYLA